MILHLRRWENGPPWPNGRVNSKRRIEEKIFRYLELRFPSPHPLPRGERVGEGFWRRKVQKKYDS